MQHFLLPQIHSALGKHAIIFLCALRDGTEFNKFSGEAAVLLKTVSIVLGKLSYQSYHVRTYQINPHGAMLPARLGIEMEICPAFLAKITHKDLMMFRSRYFGVMKAVLSLFSSVCVGDFT